MRRTILAGLMASAALFAMAPSAGAGQLETASATTVTSGPQAGSARGNEGDVSIKRNFGTWATNVNVRHNDASLTTCGMSPSTTNCPNIRGQVNRGDSFEVWCQKIGSQTVGGNPYWVYIITPNFDGWMASYYIDYPDNVLPDTRFC
ncbi:hypothetical protein [Streptomyces sp. NPDC085932]|uniref:hypothetical protein n=1 Tax=Streptomyces sp. NPDC085932 TaxID=3365741 RepID=UPI0037D6588E